MWRQLAKDYGLVAGAMTATVGLVGALPSWSTWTAGQRYMAVGAVIALLLIQGLVQTNKFRTSEKQAKLRQQMFDERNRQVTLKLAEEQKKTSALEAKLSGKMNLPQKVISIDVVSVNGFSVITRKANDGRFVADVEFLVRVRTHAPFKIEFIQFDLQYSIDTSGFHLKGTDKTFPTWGPMGAGMTELLTIKAAVTPEHADSVPLVGKLNLNGTAVVSSPEWGEQCSVPVACWTYVSFDNQRLQKLAQPA